MKHEVVRVGGFYARLWLSSDNRWKWHTRRGGKRVMCAAKALDKAKARAKAQLVALRDGRSALGEMSDKLVAEFLAWKGERADSPPVAEAVRNYVRHLTEREVQTRIIEGDLARFAAAFTGPIAEVTAAQVADYLGKLGVGPRRHNNVRSTLVTFFSYCRKLDLIPDRMTAPERTHALDLQVKRPAIYTPAEFRALLAAVEPSWRLPLAICGLAGLRTCEADHVCPQGERIDNLAKRVRRKRVKWAKNGLRHSYGSYRCAVVKSAGQVSLEMGNSEYVVRSHYLDYVERKDATKWFQCGYFASP
jgi:hypothetical protein